MDFTRHEVAVALHEMKDNSWFGVAVREAFEHLTAAQKRRNGEVFAALDEAVTEGRLVA